MKEGTFICPSKCRKELPNQFEKSNTKPMVTSMNLDDHLDRNVKGKTSNTKNYTGMIVPHFTLLLVDLIKYLAFNVVLNINHVQMKY